MFCWRRAAILKCTLTLNVSIHLSRSVLSSSKPGSTPEPTSPRGNKLTISHYDQVFGLTQIPQVVMNIDLKLEPIADKNVAPLIFTTWLLIKRINFTPAGTCFSKAPEPFGPAKSFLVNRCLKMTERCILLKLLVRKEPRCILRICE